MAGMRSSLAVVTCLGLLSAPSDSAASEESGGIAFSESIAKNSYYGRIWFRVDRVQQKCYVFDLDGTNPQIDRYDVGHESGTPIVTTFPAEGVLWAQRSIIDNDIAVILRNDLTLIYDIHSLSNPVLLHALDVSGFEIHSGDPGVFFILSRTGLFKLDLQSRENPITKQIYSVYRPYASTIKRDVAYIVDKFNRLHIVDTREDIAGSELSAIQMESSTRGMNDRSLISDGEYLYIVHCNSSGFGISVYDVTNKQDPKPAGSYWEKKESSRRCTINGVSMHDHYVFVESICLLGAFDVSDKSNPFAKDSITKSTMCYSDVSYDFFHIDDGCYRYSVTNYCEARYAPHGCEGTFSIRRIKSPPCPAQQPVSLHQSGNRAPTGTIRELAGSAGKGNYRVYDKLGRSLGTWNGGVTGSDKIMAGGVLVVSSGARNGKHVYTSTVHLK